MAPDRFGTLPTWKSATQQVGKPALLGGRRYLFGNYFWQTLYRKALLAEQRRTDWRHVPGRLLDAARRSFRLLKLQRRGVDAVTQTGGFGTVVEHVTEVAAAFGAKHLGSLREMTVVLRLGDGVR